MSENLQNDVYRALHSLAMAALNPGWSYVNLPLGTSTPWTNGTLVQALPPIPVIQDMQDQGAPINGPYITIQQSATFLAIGSTQDVGTQDVNGLRIRKQPYEAHVKLQESNSPGNLLIQVRDFVETEAGQAVLDATNVSIMDFGDITEASMLLDGRYFTQIFAEVVCMIASATPETLSYINTMNVTAT